MNVFKTTFLLTGLTLLLVFVGNTLGGNGGMVIALGMAIIMNMVSYWFSDKIVLAMYRAKEVSYAESPKLYQTVTKLTQQTNMPMPKVYIIPEQTPNAFATGRNPQHAAVAVTEGILHLLSSDELEGVLAHELAHVKNRDILISSIVAVLAGAISMLASMARWGAILGGGRNDDREGGGPLVFIVMSIIAPIAALLIQMAISRAREYEADAAGAQICGHPQSLANALKKLQIGSQRVPMDAATPATAHMFIVSPLTGGGILSLFSTHPPMEKRVAKLEAMAQTMLAR
ncbi:MAG: zinc metalloprotease HtpX [bacterium]